MRTTIAVAAVAAAITLIPAPVASADDSTSSSGTSSSQPRGPKVAAKTPAATKPAAKLAPPKINLPAPPKINLPKPPKINLPNPYPQRDVKFPGMPEMPANAPAWAKQLRLNINQFVKDHPGPGVRWVDENGNPI